MIEYQDDVALPDDETAVLDQAASADAPTVSATVDVSLLNALDHDPIGDALEILLGDHQRTGRLLPEDLARISSKRGFSAEQVDDLVRRLRDNNVTIDEEDIPDNFDYSKFDRTNVVGPKRPLLTAQEEKQLAHLYRTGRLLELAQEGLVPIDPTTAELIKSGENARAKLIVHNLRLVAWIAHKYRWAKLDFGDLYQEGIFGLIRAAEMFDPTLGFRFTTYATWWIHQSIYRGIDNTGETIRIPVHRREAIRRYNRMAHRLQVEFGGRPSIARIAAALEWTESQTAYIADIARLRTLDIDAPISEDGDTTLHDIIRDDVSLSPEQAIIDQDMHGMLTRCLGTLRPREERILRMRFGIAMAKDHTLEEIGREFDLTRERIRQIEAKALRKLKHPSRSRILRTYFD